MPVTAKVTLILGPVRSGKTTTLLGQYRDALAAGPSTTDLDRAVWLAPNGRTAADVRRQLASSRLSACLRTSVLTFADLAAQILTATPTRLNPLRPSARRELLRRIVDRALAENQLVYFADAARRSGFIDSLSEHIAELQNGNIQPAAYRKLAARLDSAEKHAELAALYGTYLTALTTQALLDPERNLTSAAQSLMENRCARFQRPDLVVADGFSDFVQTELQILEALAGRSQRLAISLVADGSARPDLFAKTTATRKQLQHCFPGLKICKLEHRPLPCPAIDRITRYIFGNPMHIPSPSPGAMDSLDQLEIVEAAGAQDEIVQIARRVKSLLTRGAARPGEILVVFRSLTDAAPRIRETFTRHGIPFFLDSSPTVATAPVIKALLDLLQLELDDWPFRRLIAVLTNNQIESFDPAARRAADWLIRDLQTPAGRDALFTRVQSLADDSTPAEQRSQHLRRRFDAATLALPLLRKLAGSLDQLPQSATATEWATALAHLGAELAISPFGPCEPAIDAHAWQSVLSEFAAVERLGRLLGEAPRRYSRTEAVALLRDVAYHERLPGPHGETGCVRILSAQAARNCSVRHLFLAGMSEQSFPAAERPGRLASDDDYRYFSAASHGTTESNLPHSTHSQDELLLFYELVSRTEVSLTISYAALDNKAQVLPPSPYVTELERLFAGDAHKKLRRSPPCLSPLAKDSTPTSIAEWRVRAVADAVGNERDLQLLAGLIASDAQKPLAAALKSGLLIVHDRSRRDSFGPTEGLLQNQDIANRLSVRFGNRHIWSASQWETYAACPFRFFVEDVLELEPLGDLVLETDFARRGSRLHDVLAAFHRDWLTIRRKRPMSNDEEASAFLAHLQRVALDRTAAGNRTGVEAALLELDRRQILKWTQRHFDNQAKYEAACKKLNTPMQPGHLEFRFGSVARSDADTDPNSTTDALEINLNGEQIKITGQIDRIDVGTRDGKTVFNVIDYKSGRRATLKRDQLESGEQLQLPLYVEAAQMLLFKNKATPLLAGYWGMGNGFDTKGALATPPPDASTIPWNETQATVHRLIRTFIDHIRRGDFPVDNRNDKCTETCDFQHMCRIRQVRSLKKVWWPRPSEDSDPATQFDSKSPPKSSI